MKEPALEKFRRHTLPWLSLTWFFIHSNKYRKTFVMFVGVSVLCGSFYGLGHYFVKRHYQELETALEQMAHDMGLHWGDTPWHGRFAMLKRKLDVALKTTKQLESFLYEKSLEIEDLKEQIYFYKSVVAPEDLQEGLSIFSVNVQDPVRRREYPVEIILRKMQKAGGAVKGNIRVSAYGYLDNKETHIDALGGEKIEFSFKYFQRVKGALYLPEGFFPRRLNITVISDRFKSFEQVYAWHDII